MIQYGVEPDRVTVVRDAADEISQKSIDAAQERLKICKKFQIAEGTPILGTAAAMTHQKGYDVLIPALKVLKERGVSFRCLIAGDGFLRKEIDSEIERLELKDVASCLGFIEDVPAFLAGLDILTYPSNNEGLGSLILDGIMAGCCVVATRVGGIPEVIIHEETGLLSEKGDVSVLADNIERVIRDPDLRGQLVKKGQSHVQEYFSSANMVAETLKIYEQLIGK
jgi:glycosyltransferase involved in cell wall biosynthesis